MDLRSPSLGSFGVFTLNLAAINIRGSARRAVPINNIDAAGMMLWMFDNDPQV